MAGHADLSVIHTGGREIFAAGYLAGTEAVSELAWYGADITFSEAVQSQRYPYDAGLNLHIAGGRVIGNPAAADRELVNLLTNHNYCILPVRQGYARCSVCPVDENSIITADAGIAGAAEKAGMDVLRVPPGLAALDGFRYGFIGGAAFKLAADKLAFTGMIEDSDERRRIEDYLKSKGIIAVYLTDGPLTDIGGAIPLMED